MAEHSGKQDEKSTEPTSDLSNVSAEVIEKLAGASRGVVEANRGWPPIEPRIAERLPVESSVPIDDAVKILRAASKPIEVPPSVLPAQAPGPPNQIGFHSSEVSPQAAKLTKREGKILPILERGVEAETYCRELDAAGLRPPRTWIKLGCPSTHEKAWREPKWNKRIRQEKYRLSRKVRRQLSPATQS